jgi:hypothetical protein
MAKWQEFYVTLRWCSRQEIIYQLDSEGAWIALLVARDAERCAEFDATRAVFPVEEVTGIQRDIETALLQRNSGVRRAAVDQCIRPGLIGPAAGGITGGAENHFVLPVHVKMRGEGSGDGRRRCSTLRKRCRT